jgi:hypothetical protein
MNAVLPAPGLLASWIEPSGHSVSNHPTSPDDPGLVLDRRLTATLLRERTHSGRVPHGVTWASPPYSRLATTTGRIEFVILRTGRSPPVAPHPASRRRSYVRLRSSNLTSIGTSTLLSQSTCKRAVMPSAYRRCARRGDGCRGASLRRKACFKNRGLAPRRLIELAGTQLRSEPVWNPRACALRLVGLAGTR